MDLLRGLFAGTPFVTPGTDLASLVQRTELLADLDRLRDDVEIGVVYETGVAGTTFAATGFSVGYVLWLTRGGLLLASLVSSMPAWRLMDPIPVLAHLGGLGDEEEDDAESLDSMLGDSSPRG